MNNRIRRRLGFRRPLLLSIAIAAFATPIAIVVLCATAPASKAAPPAETVKIRGERPGLLFTVPQAEAIQTVTRTRLEFAAVSIKPDSTANGFAAGFACHGTDGTWRSPFGSGDPVVTPQGRCTGDRVPLSRLIEFAYQLKVSGGPDWIRPGGGRGNVGSAETFQITAAAEDASSTTKEQLRQMLQTMLAERFNLKLHRETQEVAGYALVVSKNGPKRKPTSDDEEIQPGPALGRFAITGKSTFERLAQLLNDYFGSPSDGPIVDKTGLTGIYEFELVPGSYVNNTDAGGPPLSPEGRRENILSDISAALEDQLGLRLQREKVPFEVVVIDQVEKPSPN
jgi:uncharacterized protein (TIGR03435 family)